MPVIKNEFGFFQFVPSPEEAALLARLDAERQEDEIRAKERRRRKQSSMTPEAIEARKKREEEKQRQKAEKALADAMTPQVPWHDWVPPEGAKGWARRSPEQRKAHSKRTYLRQKARREVETSEILALAAALGERLAEGRRRTEERIAARLAEKRAGVKPGFRRFEADLYGYD
jgi:hypothetical protein